MPAFHHTGALAWLLLVAFSALHAKAADGRYVATFIDGSTVSGDEVRDWHDTGAQPKLGDRNLLESAPLVRSIRDQTLALSAPPPRYVEFVGGDRLPCEVIGYGSGDESPYDRLPTHLVVEPDIAVTWPDTRQRKPLHVMTRWVRRIVWQSRGGDRYLPGTLFQRDGRQKSFRSLRWQAEGVRLLMAEGTSEVPFSEIAELHLPRFDAWEAWFGQLSVLSPSLSSRILRVESDNGLRATASTERFQARNNGSHPDHWYHAVQPAWCLEPLWLRHRTIALRTYFSPLELPLSSIEPTEAEQRSVLSSSWSWQTDRNVQGGPLRAAERDFAWGLGVHAHSELTFELPPLVRRFRALAALDEAAGHGGCVRLVVHLRNAQTNQPTRPQFQSKILVGSQEVLQIGPLDIAPLSGAGPASSSNVLKLIADPVHRGRPAGADPLDIRDTVDWLEPLVELDGDQLRTEVASQSSQMMAAWQGWSLQETESAPVMLVNTWDDTDGRALKYRLQAAPRQRLIVLTREAEITPQQQALLLAVNRLGNETTAASLIVEADGQVVGKLEIPPRQSLSGPDPLWVPLHAYLGQKVTLRVTQPALGPQSVIDWHALTLVDRWPGLYPIFEDEADLVDRLVQAGGTVRRSDTDAYAGAASLAVAQTDQIESHRIELSVPIRETPRLGQYRFLRFAWKKSGGGRLCMTLGHDELWGPTGDLKGRDRRLFRYDAGPGQPSFDGALRIDKKTPEQWAVVTRDLYNDFGEFTLTGLSLHALDGGEAMFDHIYLGRSQQDFTRIEIQPTPPKKP
jgi:hypothetical protein